MLVANHVLNHLVHRLLGAQLGAQQGLGNADIGFRLAEPRLDADGLGWATSRPSERKAGRRDGRGPAGAGQQLNMVAADVHRTRGMRVVRLVHLACPN